MLKSYICDKCKKEFKFEDNINICPYCGYSNIRDCSKPMKKIMSAMCSITGYMRVVKHEDGTIEPLFFEGEREAKIIGDIQWEENINNLDYDNCSKYI